MNVELSTASRALVRSATLGEVVRDDGSRHRGRPNFTLTDLGMPLRLQLTGMAEHDSQARRKEATMSSIDGDQFRRLSSNLASGVTVITTAHRERRFGMTASSVTPLSQDPPMMLVCIHRSAPTEAEIRRAGRFAINILGFGQEALARQFASPDTDKFRGVAVSTGPSGMPLLDACLANFECDVVDTVLGGTHTIFIGAVSAAKPGGALEPLTYFRGGFGRLQSSADDAAYRAIRRWILEGGWGEAAREPAEIATVLGSDPSTVPPALHRLHREGLLARESTGAYAVSRLDVHLVEDAMRARSFMECGVVRLALGSASDDAIRELRLRFEAMAALMVGDTIVDVDSFFELNNAFHLGIVRLAACKAIDEAFARLDLGRMGQWFHASTTESTHEFIAVQGAIVAAVECRDRDAAEDAITSYTQMAIARVRELIPATH